MSTETSPKVNVEVELPPDSGPPTTDHTNPSPVVVVNPTAPSGEASMADLLARVRELEGANVALRERVEQVEASALASMLASTPPETPEETTTDPDSETPEEIIVPESSDDGPKSVPEKAKTQKPAWHRWI